MAGDSTQSGTPDLATASRARRSTRILEAVRLKIVGESRIGTAQLELTSAVAVSCHGCLYLSRHEHQRDSWMTLEVSNQHTGPKSPPVRAKVRFVRLPGNPRELYGVGVELETPANIWGIKSVPEDWLPYSDSASVATGATEAAGPAPEIQTATPSDQGNRISPDSSEFEASAPALFNSGPAPSVPGRNKSQNAANPPDELIRAWEKKLLEVAEQAVVSAVASHVKTAVKEAVNAIEIASQESILKIADGARHLDKLLIPAHVGFFSRLNSELGDAGERLVERATAFVTRTQVVVQGLGIENGAAEIQPAPTKASAFSKKLVSGQVTVRAGGDVRHSIKIDTSKMLEPAVTGWFRASGGLKHDIALVLATEYEFENLIHGHEARVLFATDSITSGQFNVSITQSGTYILAFNNQFSIFMPRTFTANIDLRYSTPQELSPDTEAPAGRIPRIGSERPPASSRRV
ncbi:MAG: hypothetical protein DMG32_00250 [Acidobacteria bacterium]|nr:MAG: hypothetical protein DMG32_00250 [Acidobacteriota bacterium]